MDEISKLKREVDRLNLYAFWSGLVTNPIAIYLLFHYVDMKALLDDLYTTSLRTSECLSDLIHFLPYVL